jgi:hypothetical protein
MPKELEEKLRRQACEKGLKGERADRYVYGTLRKTGWEPEREKKEEKKGKDDNKSKNDKKGGKKTKKNK